MKLQAAQIKELRRAADRTRKEVRVESLPEDQRELVAAFARKIDELPSAMMANLKKMVLQNHQQVKFHSIDNGEECVFPRCLPT